MVILSLILMIYFGLGILVDLNAFYTPDYTQVDLLPILSQESFSDEDYATLYEQTGLGQTLIDTLKQEADFKERILTFQTQYFKEAKALRTPMNFITRIDQVQDDAGNWQQAFILAPYEEGDIFLTKSTHTFNFRHGHAAIVIDAVRGKLLESLEPGTVSMEQDASKWVYYPTFKMMRLKDASKEERIEIANYANQHLRHLPYNIFASKHQPPGYTSTQCSLLVWQAFDAFNIDLDSNGGYIVSPCDIAKSPFLETLQIYGFSPHRDW